MLRFVDYLARLDGLIIDAFEKWVADPLQDAGVSLLAQYYTVTVAMVIILIIDVVADPSWFNASLAGVLILQRLLDVFVDDGTRAPRLRRPPDDGTIRLNPLRASMPFVRVVIAIVISMTTVASHSSGWRYNAWSIGFILLLYIDACTPKPPRSRRVPAKMRTASV